MIAPKDSIPAVLLLLHSTEKKKVKLTSKNAGAKAFKPPSTNGNSANST